MFKNCEGITRRDCLQIGLGAGLGGFVSLLRARAAAAAPTTGTPRKPTSCILVWLDGGPSHYETFDPKDDAPREIRGAFESIPTKVPGVRFSKNMKRLAAVADKLCIVRSIRHNQNNHGAGNHYMMTGAPTTMPVSCGAHVSFHPSLGSVTAMERGAPEGLPPYFALGWRMTRSGGPNFLGAKYAPFAITGNPADEDFRVRDVALPRGLDTQHFLGRTDLRSQVDRFVRITERTAGDPVAAMDDYYRQGVALVTSKEAQQAFDLHAEPKEVRDKFGYLNDPWKEGRPNNTGFGQRLLLARRLVETGVPFVTVYMGGWDHHGGIFPALDKKLPVLDHGLAALIEDLDERGLLDTTLVVALGEFGRTPTINESGGRDHWSNAMSVLFAGCGTPGGAVIGSTDRKGYSPTHNAYSPENFASTIYQKLGIDSHKILYTPAGRPVHMVTDPNPIPELMG